MNEKMNKGNEEKPHVIVLSHLGVAIPNTWRNEVNKTEVGLGGCSYENRRRLMVTGLKGMLKEQEGGLLDLKQIAGFLFGWRKTTWKISQLTVEQALELGDILVSSDPVHFQYTDLRDGWVRSEGVAGKAACHEARRALISLGSQTATADSAWMCKPVKPWAVRYFSNTASAVGLYSKSWKISTVEPAQFLDFCELLAFIAITTWSLPAAGNHT